jgi:hypothetical protein
MLEHEVYNIQFWKIQFQKKLKFEYSRHSIAISTGVSRSQLTCVLFARKRAHEHTLKPTTSFNISEWRTITVKKEASRLMQQSVIDQEGGE